MNVSLTPELEKFVHQEVMEGNYQTASEVIRAGLRLLKQNHLAPRPKTPASMQELEEQLLGSVKRLAAGQGEDGEKVFRRLRQRIKKARSDGKVHI